MYPEGDLTFGRSGNIYGTTQYGGNAGWGVIYELVPSGGSSTRPSFIRPKFMMTELTPPVASSSIARAIFTQCLLQVGPSGTISTDSVSLVVAVRFMSWTRRDRVVSSLPSLEAKEGILQGGLIIDSSNNLYGTTSGGGPGGAGTVFELAATTFNLNLLYTFSENGIGPQDELVMDAIGDLYGTTSSEGVYGHGSVFKLTPSSGGWTYTSLHDFTGGSDGDFPNGNLVFDVNGNLYGTTYWGGTGAWGVVFEITP